jgi:hypothetical protein
MPQPLRIDNLYFEVRYWVVLARNACVEALGTHGVMFESGANGEDWHVAGRRPGGRTLHVTLGVHLSKGSFLGNHKEITINGKPTFAG